MRDWDPVARFGAKEARHLDRFAQFALAAAEAAVEDSGIDFSKLPPEQCGVFIGSGIGGLNEFETQHSTMIHKGPSRISPFTIPKLMVNAGSGHISIRWGLHGPCSAIATACASAANAIGDAFKLIQSGDADVMITGGSEAAITHMGLGGFAAMRALSTRNDDPPRASRPFDRDRDGFVMGEGAGILDPRGRGDRPGPRRPDLRRDARLRHVGRRLAHHRTRRARPRRCPRHEALPGRRPPRRPRRRLHQRPRHQHPAGRPGRNHRHEVRLRNPRPPAADLQHQEPARPPAGCLRRRRAGHRLALAIETDVLPPTINLDHPGEGCDLDYIPNVAREARVNYVMSNSFGFGGHNASLLIGRYFPSGRR